MILKRYRQTSVILTMIAIVITLLVFNSPILAFTLLLGSIISNINLLINEKFLDISGQKNSLKKNLSNYFFRIFLYTIALITAYKLGDMNGLFLCFIGCLMIRISIIIYTLKEVLIDGHN